MMAIDRVPPPPGASPGRAGPSEPAPDTTGHVSCHPLRRARGEQHRDARMAIDPVATRSVGRPCPAGGAADPSLTEKVRCHPLRARARGTAARPFANPPTAACVGGVDPLRPVQLDERGFSPPFGGVRKPPEDNNLSLSPPTLSSIWRNGGVKAGRVGFHFAKAWRSGELPVAPRPPVRGLTRALGFSGRPWCTRQAFARSAPAHFNARGLTERLSYIGGLWCERPCSLHLRVVDGGGSVEWKTPSGQGG
jgi:hypothetical protein